MRMLIDSGASAHIINDISCLSNFTPLSLPRYVRCANGAKLAVLGTGSCGPLDNVLYVPEATMNLISVSQLTRAGARVTFTTNKVFLNSAEIGSLSGKLYTVNSSSFMSDDADVAGLSDDIESTSVDFIHNDYADVSPASNSHLSHSIELLHRRFGHVDIAMINRMLARDSVDGLHIAPSVSNPNKFHCEACSLAKAAKQSRVYEKRQRRHLAVVNKDLYFHCVYSDVLGPINPVAIGGYSYGITFTEYGSRYRWFYPLKAKSDALSAFKSLVAEVSAQGFRVRMLRSDNGGEYTSEAFKQYCINEKIEHRFTQPNTPSANSPSERYNRTLGERGRAMLSGAKLPDTLWAEAMATATYIYNRTISPVDDVKTPYEILYGARPDVSNLRAYGCIAYMYNFDQRRQKLHDRAIKGVLVGYDLKSSSYLVHIPGTTTIRRSGHVTFNEHELYFTDESLAVANRLAARKSRKVAPLVEPVIPIESVQVGPPAGPASVPASPPPSTIESAVESVQVPLSGSAGSSAVSPEPPVTSVVAPSSAALDNTPAAVPTTTFISHRWPIDESTKQTKRVRKQSLRAKLAAESSPRRSKKSADRVSFLADEHAFKLEELLSDTADTTSSLLNDAPSTYNNIRSRADKEMWYAATRSENESLRSHGVFEVVDSLPPGKNLVKARTQSRERHD
jgi:hypothetical protein